MPIEAVERPDDTLEQVKQRFASSNEIQNSINLSKDKLDIVSRPYKSPPSTETGSSLPSTSFGDANSTSAFSSPPPETSDITPTQKNIEYVNNATFGSDSDTKCPVCKEAVDKIFFEGYVDGNRLTVRQQSQFCKAHKKHTAEVAWEERGFPKIDWHRLDARLKDYHIAIDDILQGRKFSFYRNAFEDLVKSRKKRTLRQNLMNGEETEELIPGYYGSRGARIMYEDRPQSFL